MNTFTRRAWRGFFAARADTLLARFATLPNATATPLYTFVPGTRPAASRVLLVAHADTVAQRPPRRSDIRWRHGRVYAPGKILGADDRAGVAMLWSLRTSGHSLLLTDLEETGGIGATHAAQEIARKLRRHAFAVQFDRRGAKEGVFYPGTRSDAFASFLRGAFPSWRFGWGSYTDIATLCPACDLCGVNLAVGFTGEHTTRERFNPAAWEHTRHEVLRVLGAKTYPPFSPAPRTGRDRLADVMVYGVDHAWSRDDIAVLSDAGQVKYYVPVEDTPLGIEGAIPERDLLAYWGVGDSIHATCPACGLALTDFDRDRCPDCGVKLPGSPLLW